MTAPPDTPATDLHAVIAGLRAERDAALGREAALAEVLQLINRSQADPQPVFDAILERAMRLCEAAFGSFFIYENGEDMRFRAVAHRGVPSACAEFRERVPLSGRDATTPVGRLVAAKRIVHVPDYMKEASYKTGSVARRVIVDAGGARTLVLVPLLKEGTLIGLFSIYRTEVKPFADHEIALLERFAEQAVIARREDDVYRSASTFAFSPEFRPVAQQLVFEPGRGSVIGRAAEARAVIQVDDLAVDRDYALPEAISVGKMRTALGVPLLRAGEPMGVLYLARQRVEPFSERQIELVRTFADQAVIAIENARLLTEQSEALERQAAIAEVLGVINANPGDLGPVFEAMLERAMRLCEAGFGELDVYDGQHYRVTATLGVPAAFDKYRRSNPGLGGRAGSFSGRLVAGEEFIHIVDLTGDDLFLAGDANRRAIVEFGGARTVLVAPLRQDKAVLGFIVLYRQEVRPFSDQQITLLQNFAAQAVIAMENARLLDEIRQRQAELRVTFDNMGDGVVMFDAKHCLAAWNRNFKELLEIPDVVLAERPSYASYLHLLAERGEFGTVDIESELARRLGDTEQELRLERTRPDGRVIEVRRNPVAGGGFVLIYADITERKRNEEVLRAARDASDAALRELQVAQANLVQAEKMASLGQLTAGIAHEIKNPLNFVNNFSDLSIDLLDELNDAVALRHQEEIDELSATLKGNLEKIAEHGRRADGIVRSMLEHSRGNAGERRSVEFNVLVEEALNLAYHGARAQDQDFNITMQRNFAEGMAPIELVPQDMTRVLLNLIGNGFYATTARTKSGADPGFVPTLNVTTRDLGEAVEVRVRDNGVGIPDGIRDKLFQPFFTTKPTGEGTGLGLSISYDIVTQQHGGSITVDSKVGEYSEFTIRLPRAAAPAATHRR